MANPWDNDPIVKAAPSKTSGGMPWDNDPIVKAAEPKTGVVEDMAKSAASGAARGGLGLVGLPGTIADVLRKGADIAADQTIGRAVNYANTGSFEAPSPPPSADLIRERTGIPDPGQAISGQALTDAAASVVPGIKYQPQTEAGKVAATIGEFTPGFLSPGTIAQRVVGGVLAPALTSEALGRTAAHLSPSLEQPARLVGALAGGVAGTLATRPSTAQAAVSAGMRGVDDAIITAAGQLMQEANTRGIALTWPEAIAQASNGGGRGLTNMQRVVEGSQGGGDVMGAFMAQRPAQIASAARREFDQIAPQSQAPSTIGPAVGQAAGERIAEVRGAINNATDPLYRAAEAVRVSPQEAARVQALPGYAEAANAIRSTPQLARYVQGLPDDSVGFLNEVKKFLGTASDNAAGPMNANKNMQISAGYGLDEGVVRQAASAASPEYARALAVQEQARKQFLDPLMQGPIGKLADKDITTRQAIGVLFPSNPLPGSAPEIVDAVGALAKKNPMAARQLVRAHVESSFNEATQALQSGANQFGGAGFAAVLKGNTQQAENLAAAIQGVAGPQALSGFDKFLDIMSATGQRQRIGSQTAFNQETQDILRRGGMIGEAANTVATAGVKLPGRVKEAYEQWRLGRNTEQIAKLFTDPNAIEMFRRLGRAAPGSSQAQAISARLAIMATQASQAANRPVP
jgi:hypothetical protein